MSMSNIVSGAKETRQVPDSKTSVPKKRNPSAQIYKWARWLHVYISTGTLLLVLFFSLTGITLNHPDWMLGSRDVSETLEGTLPSSWKTGDTVNWLEVAEYLRNELGVHGEVSDYRNDDSEAQISFNAPGYSADAFIEMDTGTYSLSTDSQGWVAVLNDLHRGRDTGTAWRWVIDLSAVFLVLVSVTGIALLLFLKKIRLTGLVTVVVGSALAIAFMMLAR
jgi:uncharacterized protein